MKDYRVSRWLIVLIGGSAPITAWYSCTPSPNEGTEKPMALHADYWLAPDPERIADPLQKKLVLYGKELIVHTSRYFGPAGSVTKTANGLNCQNCHLSAGTAVFGNNYGSVASLYPKFRARSGTIETIVKRINDCFERSLNAHTLAVDGREMRAISAYINFLGGNVAKGRKANGSGLGNLPYLSRAADPVKGKEVYLEKCRSCHQSDGAGVPAPGGREFIYPPLWGASSYTDAAGLFRITNAANYIKCNMPQGVSFQNPQLSDAEAWDVAAFINSQARPHKSTSGDWPDVTLKPVDCPTGPYADNFSERDHKYGPFGPIEVFKKNK